MKLYAPSYYKKFKCIADKCRHSCCIGWEIDIDEFTLGKYQSAEAPYASEVLKSIEDSENPHFKLCGGGRCVHLDENNLCRIILNLGEGYLCDICREHPRFYNTVKNGMEVGLGMACEEACSIILNSDGYSEISEICELGYDEESPEFDACVPRQRLFSILSNCEKRYNERLFDIYNEFSVSPNMLGDEKTRFMLSRLEYLDSNHQKLFFCYSGALFDCDGQEKILERALAYFVYRHCSGVEDIFEFRAALGFCLICERLLASLLKNCGDAVELARIISEELEYSEDNTEAIKSKFRLSFTNP